MNYRYEEGLETERLITRFLTPEDVSVWTKFLSDTECAKFLPNPESLPPEDRAVYWILTQIANYKNKKYGFQALLDKKTGEFIGQFGLLLSEVDGQVELEVAGHILKEHWGKGYGGEALKMFKDYGLRNEQAKSIVGLVHKDNLRSQKMAIKAGLEKEKETKWYDFDIFLFRAYPYIHKV